MSIKLKDTIYELVNKAEKDGAGNVITAKYVTIDTVQDINEKKTFTKGLSLSENTSITYGTAEVLGVLPKGWTGLPSDGTAIGVGTVSHPLYLRSSGDNLFHYNTTNSKAYIVLDENNYKNYFTGYVKDDKRSPNTVFAGPASGTTSEKATFRVLIEKDIPLLSISKISGLQNALDGKSNVGHTHTQYLPIAGGSLTGSIGMNKRYLIKPNSEYVTNTSKVTGAICIELPASFGNTMISLWIDVYNYSTGIKAFSVHVGGYTYTDGNTWYNNPSAIVYGEKQKIQLGHNGTSFCIYIGETTTAWSYPQVSVRDVLLGYNMNDNYSNWSKKWKISFVTSMSNVTATINDYAYTTRNFSDLTSTLDTRYLKLSGGTLRNDNTRNFFTIDSKSGCPYIQFRKLDDKGNAVSNVYFGGSTTNNLAFMQAGTGTTKYSTINLTDDASFNLREYNSANSISSTYPILSTKNFKITSSSVPETNVTVKTTSHKIEYGGKTHNIPVVQYSLDISASYAFTTSDGKADAEVTNSVLNTKHLTKTLSVKRGSWSYAGNGYTKVNLYKDQKNTISEPKGSGYIDLAGCTIFKVGSSSSCYTQLFITAPTQSNSPSAENTVGQIYYYIDNGSGYYPTWYRVLNHRNWSDYCAPASHSHPYLPLAGGTMTGTVTFDYSVYDGAHINFKNKRVTASSGGWADNILSIQNSEGNTISRYAMHGSNDKILYVYLGQDSSYSGKNFRVYSDKVTFGDYTIYHSGNCSFYDATLKRKPNYVLAGPKSGTTDAAATFRELVEEDIPHNLTTLIPKSSVKDERNVSTTPNSYLDALIFQGIKTNNILGLSISDTYSYVLGLRGWSDNSGGNSWEFAFNNKGINVRRGGTTSWNPWYKILTSEDSSVSLSGNTLTVKINGVSKSLTNTNTTYSAGTGIISQNHRDVHP